MKYGMARKRIFSLCIAAPILMNSCISNVETGTDYGIIRETCTNQEPEAPCSGMCREPLPKQDTLMLCDRDSTIFITSIFGYRRHFDSLRVFSNGKPLYGRIGSFKEDTVTVLKKDVFNWTEIFLYDDTPNEK